MTADASNYGNRQDCAKAQALPVENYFQDMRREFVDIADVELCIGGKRLPAHSQFLASQSRFMARMIEDLQVLLAKPTSSLFLRRPLGFLSVTLCASWVRSTTSATIKLSQPQRHTSSFCWQSCLILKSSRSPAQLSCQAMQTLFCRPMFWRRGFLFAEKDDLAFFVRHASHLWLRSTSRPKLISV